jgi:hypothetical protein
LEASSVYPTPMEGHILYRAWQGSIPKFRASQAWLSWAGILYHTNGPCWEPSVTITSFDFCNCELPHLVSSLGKDQDSSPCGQAGWCWWWQRVRRVRPAVTAACHPCSCEAHTFSLHSHLVVYSELPREALS